jgi:AP-1-like factor
VATQPPKKDLIAQIDSKLEEEVVPGEDKSQMLSCTKIWYVFLRFERIFLPFLHLSY